jgi:hypothetical protein
MFVTWRTRGSREPPSIFSKTGKFLGKIARRGAGPGEMTLPRWVSVGEGDTVRIYDIPRVVTFDSSWQHVRTETEVRGFILQGSVVPLGNGTYVALGSEPLQPTQARPIHLQRTRVGSRVLKEITTPGDAGRLRVLAPTFDGGRGGRFWFAQFSLIDFGGYDLYLADTLGLFHTAIRRRPSWWHRETTSQSPAPTGTSRVVSVRQIDNDLVAVLVAQPLPNWREIPIDSQSFAGVHSWYKTFLELVDVNAGTIKGQARVDGYPIALLRDRRLAVYRELEDGTPIVEIVGFAVQPK